MGFKWRETALREGSGKRWGPRGRPAPAGTGSGDALGFVEQRGDGVLHGLFGNGAQVFAAAIHEISSGGAGGDHRPEPVFLHR